MTVRKAVVLVLVLVGCSPPPPKPSEDPIHSTMFINLNFVGVKPGDWVEYEENGRIWRVALLRVNSDTLLIETNRGSYGDWGRTFLVELDAKNSVVRGGWVKELSGEIRILTLEKPSPPSKDDQGRSVRSLAASLGIPLDFDNESGFVEKETLRAAANRAFDCLKFTEQKFPSGGFPRTPDLKVYWICEEIPPFLIYTGRDRSAQFGLGLSEPYKMGGEVCSTHTRGTEDLWDRKLVNWGHDAKQTLAIPGQ